MCVHIHTCVHLKDHPNFVHNYLHNNLIEYICFILQKEINIIKSIEEGSKIFILLKHTNVKRELTLKL